jgi:hypothetical protein
MKRGATSQLTNQRFDNQNSSIMKKNIAYYGAAAIVLAAIIHAGAEIISGPVTNQANGHDYYLLAANTWTASEAEAENLGGTLAVIRNAAEQEWVFSKFGSNGDLWIGLHRKVNGGPFFWPAEEPVDYTNWYPGEPNNVGGIENAVHMRKSDDRPGTWNDLADSSLLCAVVEVPGKSNPESLTKPERALVGTWYARGKADRPCRIAATQNILYAINENLVTSRATYTTDGNILLSNWRIYGEISGDKIFWSDGYWWSRTPVKYETAGQPEAR